MKRLTLLFLVLTLIIVFFIFSYCQKKEDYSQLISDAEDIYSYVDDEFSSGKEMSSYQKEEMYDFKETYINSYDNYKKEKELLSYMEQLVFGYEFYYIAMGQDDKKLMNQKEKEIKNALKDLDEYFNE